MSELKGKEKVDNGDHSWLELLLKFVACLVTEMENKMMIEELLLKFVACLVTEMENKMMIEKRGSQILS
ncbi:hypothetical protein Gotur_023264 [Gossypium turneri]